MTTTKQSKTSKTTKTTKQQSKIATAAAPAPAAPANVSVLALFTPEQLAALTPEQLAALAALANTSAAPTQQPAPTTAAAPAAAPADRDELAERRDKTNAAIIATVPAARRATVTAALKRLHKAGYRYARLETNKEHQRDACSIYAGEKRNGKGCGRDAEFIACQTKRAAEYVKACAEAAAAGKPKPKPLTGVFYWSPRGGGKLYARGIFGNIAD